MHQHIVNSPLPSCRQSVLRDFLNSKNWIYSESLSDDIVEVWVDPTGYSHVEIYKEFDPIPFEAVTVIIEHQMGVPLYSMPFYAKHISQRFPEA